MNKNLAEITEIPVRALAILETAVPSLPLQVPYLGMGSSYFACFQPRLVMTIFLMKFHWIG